MRTFSIGVLANVAVAGAVSLTTRSNPVTKVVNLLKGMKSKLQADIDQAEKTNDKITCWCNEIKDLMKKIENSDQIIQTQQARIETESGNQAAAVQALANSEEDLANHEANLKKQTDMNNKRIAEFQERERFLNDSITALKSALVALKKHNSLGQVKAIINGIVAKKSKIMSLLQQAPGATGQGYESQSGQIFGMLKQMNTEFQDDLKDARDQDEQDAATFTEMKQGLEAQIAATREAIKNAKEAKASAEENIADARDIKQKTEALLNSQEKMARENSKTCEEQGKKYAEVVKQRADEMEAITGAIGVLSSDKTFAAKNKVEGYGSSFLQTNLGRIVSMNRVNAAKALKTAGSPRLNLLAFKMIAKDSVFAELKQEVDNLVAELEARRARETAERDSCIKVQNDRALQIQDTEQAIAESKAEIERTETKIEQLTNDLATANEELKTAKIELNKAGDDRKEQNTDYQTNVSDQKNFISQLAMAQKKLNAFYGKKAALVQTQQDPIRDQPEAGMSQRPELHNDFKAKGGRSVMDMIQQFVDDCNKNIAVATEAEASAQKEYETYVKDNNKMQGDYNSAIATMTVQKATAEKHLSSTKTSLNTQSEQLEQLQATQAEHIAQCKFIVENHDIRQKNTDTEIKALRDAKSYLEGMESSGAAAALLQKLRQ